MGVSALIGGGLAAAGSVASSIIGGNAAESAAQTQANAANQAAQTQLGMYNQTRTDLAPYLNTGNSALSQLASIWGLNPSGGAGTGPNAAAATSALTQFPGYQFGLQQGQTALDHSAASQGLLLSGAQQQASQQFGQNYAMQQAWQPYISQLSGLASVGENAGAQVGNAGIQTGSGVASDQLAAGQASASGTVGAANALTSGLNNALSSGTLSYLLQGGGGGAQSGGMDVNSFNQTPTLSGMQDIFN